MLLPKLSSSNLAFFFLFSFFNYIYTLQYNTIQNNINSVTVKKQISASEVTRSTAAGILTACPMDDLAPRMAWIDRRRIGGIVTIEEYCYNCVPTYWRAWTLIFL